MRITPLDVRKQEFRKAVRGLDADEVQAFLATVADEYEFVLTDNKKLREKVIELDEKVGEYRNMEKTLRDTLLTAERVMTEARQNARKEADLILRDAQMKASQEVAGISGRVEALHQQIRELRGHRDSYVARLQSLSEAQIGLIDSYRKDFESTDARIERAADASANPGPEAASSPVPAPEISAPEPSIPAWDAPPAGGGQDQWRSYALGQEEQAPPAPPVDPQPVSPQPVAPEFVAPTPPEPVRDELASAPVEPYAAPEAPAPEPQPGPDTPHLHTPEPLAWDESIYPPVPEYALEAESGYVEQLNDDEYDARVASVADAWSGAVPRVESDQLPVGDATAIDEVSAALGMFNEESDVLPEPASLEGESTSVPPVTGAPSSPWPSNELASDGLPMESVDSTGGADGPADESIDASTESGEQSGDGRWSLSRIARGLTGN